VNTDAGHKQLSKKKLFRLLVWGCILLAVFAVVFSVFRQIRTSKALAKIDAAKLVRNVRKSENWVHDVNSLLIRVKSKWTKTPKGISVRRAELKERFPNLKPDPNQYWGLKSNSTGSLEFAVRQGSKENRQLRHLRDTPGQYCFLEIFDGKDRLFYNKYITPPNEFYIITNPKKISVELFGDMGWPRAQYHFFWSSPIKPEQMLSEIGSAEGFICIGRQDYRGIDCYVLKCEPPGLRGLIKHWYIGVKDGLLYGNIILNSNSKKTEYWTLDYKEVAPSCWYPMTQGYELYGDKWFNIYIYKWLNVYLDSRRDLEVLEVRVNEQLPDELFEMQFKPGIKVNDERKYPPEDN
jgi:hypothetical protein